MYYNELYHHGIRGQKWGVRNGPPYPLKGGDYTITEREKIFEERRNKNSIYNKKHFDKVLESKNTTLRTLSYDKDRTKNVDMFYAVTDTLDKHKYNALFNKKLPRPIFDSDGKEIGIEICYKFKIDNKLASDIKVASEDSGAKAFTKLYNTDRDFYNFVMNKERMEKHFVSEKYKFKGYREAKKVLDKMKDGNYVPTDTDLKIVYRMFNYILPSSGKNSKESRDVFIQRAKFFNTLSKEGYGAVLDTNDAIYGGFKANSPVIVFDMDKVILNKISNTRTSDKIFSEMVISGRRFLKL